MTTFPDSTDFAPAVDLARRLLDALALGTQADPGVTRVAYGEGECLAFQIVAEAGSAFGAEVRHDPAGNMFVTIPGRVRGRHVLIGSHMDSVPHGGNFDGAAGVILGIALQSMLVARGIVPVHDLTVVALRAEESCWFPHSYIGSRTALGKLAPEALDRVRRSDTGMSLAAHMAALGFVPDAVRAGRTLLSREEIVAYIEPHIEQTSGLLNAGLPVGIVTGIRGSFRYRNMRCIGEYAHSGATPRADRRDAALAAGRLICAMDDYWQQAQESGADLTVTFGQVSTHPDRHSFSKVAGEVDLCIDVRSQDEAALHAAEMALMANIRSIEAQTGARFELGERTGSTPALMSPPLMALLREGCAHYGIPTQDMPSGAGHDAATFAEVGIPTAMIFIRNAHGSHNPDEMMEIDDLGRAIEVVAFAIAHIGQMHE
ncbi:hydantoinase/carbamoylase family amidase [Gluconacetobacter takamatsuzukensis]|uniref:Hydantoinase/carbamoylase family amidase n=1 Tax=Gluconacetobacter takamatsuzukensis TaxID=1286190 RepID=A0A7W4PTL5_9PROT|nr:hydantoinase/carbamoylase family amidase [Gluconacetobacter takamatsuzukensis]MBB2206096.1 hydantoinase/carbamoylase family amidase [Gluconacetobacter takamatsuzukensis]